MENFTNINTNLQLEHLEFGISDYALFVGMLLISTLIGVYFGIYKKQKNLSEYLLGGKNMKIFPVAVSLAASYTSAITVLGMPSEIYDYGTQYTVSCIIGFCASFIIATVYLPVFYELKVNSSFEYLSLRYGRKVRVMASFISVIGFIFNIPIVLYVPTMALKIVSGIDMMYIVPSVCVVCIFYTTIGGLKAVVWTDTIQFLMMNGAIFLIILLGIPNEGGLSEIWKTAEDTGRIEFLDLEWSMYKRTTFWSMFLGMGLGWISSLGVNETCVQRFLSLPTLSDAKKVLFIYCGFITIMKALCLFSGLIIYARYHGCDPVSSGIITKSDGILPYYVMDTTRNLPGLPGMFIAGIFSAALSTASTFLNTSAGVIFRDFINPFLPSDVTEKKTQYIVQALVVIIGIISMVLVFWVESLGQILEISISFNGINAGAILGIFTVGMLIPRLNSMGATIGSFVSFIITSWIVFGNKMSKIKYPKKKFSVEDCVGNVTLIEDNYDSSSEEDIFPLYRISFMWYFTIGFVIMVFVAVPVSYMTAPPSLAHTKCKFFSPVIRKYLPKEILLNDDKDEMQKEHEMKLMINVDNKTVSK